MLSWILASRNDGYGGDVAGVANFAMFRLQLTVDSIRRHRPDDEILIVEWCPPANHPRVGSFLVGRRVRIIPVKPVVQEWLDMENPSALKLGFYEYLAKHIGIRMATSDRLILANPDNVFPSVGFNGDAVDRGVVVRGLRCEISRQYAQQGIEVILAQAEEGSLAVMREYPRAVGDYMGLHRADYWDWAGYDLRHINWHTDNDLLYRLKKSCRVVSSYAHYHLAHEFSNGEAPGRSKDWSTAPAIGVGTLKQILVHGIAEEERR